MRQRKKKKDIWLWNAINYCSFFFSQFSLACQMWKESIHCPLIVTAVEVFQWQRWGRHQFELKLKRTRKQIVTFLYIMKFTTVPPFLQKSSRKENKSASAQVLPLYVCVFQCYRVKKWNLKRKRDIDKIVHSLSVQVQQLLSSPTLNIPSTVYKAHLS